MKLSRLSYTLAGLFLCYGAMVFSFGPCLTSMADAFVVPVGRLGLLFTLYAVGLIPSVLVNGYLAEVRGRRQVLLAAIAITGLGCGGFGLVGAIGGPRGFLPALLASVVLGYGGGGIEVLTNVLITDDNQPAQAFALNVTHAFFAIGAVLSPLAISLLLRYRLPWQWVFYGDSVLFAVLLAALTPQRMPEAAGEAPRPRAAVGMLRSRLLWVLLAVIALYVGAEIGVSTWVSPLMETMLGTPRDLAGLAVSLFWLLMIVGRLLTGPLSLRFRPVSLLLGMAMGSAISSLAVACATGVAACLVATSFTALFMSGIFALVLVDASRHLPQRLGIVFGIIMTGVGIGSLIIPAAMGAIADAFGLRAAMLVPTGLLGIVTLVYVARWRR
jgi:fucose permease